MSSNIFSDIEENHKELDLKSIRKKYSRKFFIIMMQ